MRGRVAKYYGKERKMQTQTLQRELNECWLELPPARQELIVMLLRILTKRGDVTDEDLPNYRQSVERTRAEIEKKYGKQEES